MTKKLLPAAVLALLCLFEPAGAQAQEKKRDKYRLRPTRDTVAIQIGPRGSLVVPVRSVRQFEVEGLNSLLQQISRDLATAVDSGAVPVTVIYQEQGEGKRRLQVNTKEGVERSELYYLKENGEIRSRTTPDSIVVERANGQRLFIVLDHIALMQTYRNVNADSLITALKQEIETDGQMIGTRDALIPYGGLFKVTLLDPANRASPSARKISTALYEDFGLGVILGAGVGLVRDKVVPEFGAGIAYRFPRMSEYIGLKFTWHYFFGRRPDESYRMDINTFMSLEVGNKFNSGRSLSIGYLIHRSGNYFQGITFKISQSLGTEKVGKLRLVPELIITNNFRVYFPGIRLGIMF